MFRRTGAIALAAAASTAILLPSAAAARTKIVFAGSSPSTSKIANKLLPKGFVNTYRPGANAFFLRKVTIHSGDKVKFINLGFHTIDLPGPSGKALPAIPPIGGLASGVNDAAGAPFWFNGKRPNIGTNPVLVGKSGPSTYDGTTRADSGIPAGPAPKPFVIKFTKLGTYKYFCDVHPGMAGVVVVKAKQKKIPTAKQDAATLVKEIKAELHTAIKVAKTKIPADTISVGMSAPGLELYSMFPASLSVKVGTVVTFTVSKQSYETHTATFGPTSYLVPLAAGFTGAKYPPEGVFPSDPTMPLTLTRTSHGNGFANTGALDQDPASLIVPSSGTIKFTQAGKYPFICLIHPLMRGTIVVTQ